MRLCEGVVNRASRIFTVAERQVFTAAATGLPLDQTVKQYAHIYSYRLQHNYYARILDYYSMLVCFKTPPLMLTKVVHYAQIMPVSSQALPFPARCLLEAA